MRPHETLQLQQTIAQTLAVLKGDFDKEIAALKAATADWDKRNNLDEEVKRISKAQADLAQAQAGAKNEAAAHDKRLGEWQSKLSKLEADLKNREANYRQAKANLLNDQSDFEQQKLEWKKNADIMAAELATKLRQAGDELTALNDRAKEIAKREANVKQAMAQVGALVQ